MMDIEKLLTRFYDGMSTPEEERLLIDYFRNNVVDDHLKADQQLIESLYADEILLPEGVSERLEQTIRQFEKQPRPNKRRMLLYRIGRVAAVILLCVGLFFVTRQADEPQLTDTFDDPAEAALAAEQALAFMSSHLNKGLAPVADAGQEFEKVNQVLNKHFK